VLHPVAGEVIGKVAEIGVLFFVFCLDHALFDA
jgi:hypothetical protein